MEKNLIPALLGIFLFAGGLGGCQSSSNQTPAASSGDTMSGTGGGNGTFGSNPAQAMHSNPSGTPVSPATQPGQ